MKVDVSPILGLHRHESQAVRGEPNIGEPQLPNTLHKAIRAGRLHQPKKESSRY